VNKVIYEIQVKGRVEGPWEDWFEGLCLRYENGDGRKTVMTLAAEDQSKLRGVLTQIMNLNLTIISVKTLREEENP